MQEMKSVSVCVFVCVCLCVRVCVAFNFFRNNFIAVAFTTHHTWKVLFWNTVKCISVFVHINQMRCQKGCNCSYLHI